MFVHVEQIDVAEREPSALEGRSDGRRRSDPHQRRLDSSDAPLHEPRERLDALWRIAQSLNPDAVLERGYARVTAADGRTLTSRALAAQEAALALHFRDGVLDVLTSGDASVRAPSKAKPAARPAPPEQGKLL